MPAVALATSKIHPTEVDDFGYTKIRTRRSARKSRWTTLETTWTSLDTGWTTLATWVDDFGYRVDDFGYANDLQIDLQT